MYSSVVTGLYLRATASLQQFGRHSILAPWFGLQKNAMLYRRGVSPTRSSFASESGLAGGATMRRSVERSVSLGQRARRSPALTTIGPGWCSLWMLVSGRREKR
jgi:hypothetical protein